MFSVIHELCKVLDMIKGFNTGYTTSNKDAMLVNIYGITYKLTIQKLEESEFTLDTVDKYL